MLRLQSGMATDGKPKRVRFNQRVAEVAKYLEEHPTLPTPPTVPAVATSPGGEQTLDPAKYAAILEPVFRKQRLSKLAELDPEHPDPVKAIDVLNRMDRIYAPETPSVVNNDNRTQILMAYSEEQLEWLIAAMKKGLPAVALAQAGVVEVIVQDSTETK